MEKDTGVYQWNKIHQGGMEPEGERMCSKDGMRAYDKLVRGALERSCYWRRGS